MHRSYKSVIQNANTNAEIRIAEPLDGENPFGMQVLNTSRRGIVADVSRWEPMIHCIVTILADNAIGKDDV